MFSALAVLSLVAFSNAGLLTVEHRSTNEGLNLTPNNVYLPPSTTSTGVSPSNVNTYSSQSTLINTQVPRQVAIVRQANENNGDGTFVFSYETEDGQTAEARGQLQNDGSEGVQATQGSYSYTGADGVRYTVTYTAGANGFEAQGAHLPVAPPVPEAIVKALAENAADEARGIFDDGSYREETSAGQRNTVGVAQINYQQQVQQNVQAVNTNYQQGVQTVNQQVVQPTYQLVQVSSQGIQRGVQTGYQQGASIGTQLGAKTVYPQAVHTGYQQVVQTSSQPIVQTSYQQGLQTGNQVEIQTGYQQVQGSQTGNQLGVQTGYQQVQQQVQQGVQTGNRQTVQAGVQQVTQNANQQTVQTGNQLTVQSGYPQTIQTGTQQVQTGYQQVIPSRPFHY